jgi:hypothetical protein
MNSATTLMTSHTAEGEDGACDEANPCEFQYKPELTATVSAVKVVDGGRTVVLGSVVEIFGAGFDLRGAAATVQVGAATCTVTPASANNTYLQCTVGDGTNGWFHPTVVLDNVGAAVVADDVEQLYYDLTITAVAPHTGGFRGGETITMSGSGFSETMDDNLVRIGGSRCTVSSATTTELQCIVPESACLNLNAVSHGGGAYTDGSGSESSGSDSGNTDSDVGTGSWCAGTGEFCVAWEPVVNDTDLIRFTITGQTNGWIALGLVDQPSQMKSGDVAMCWVDDASFGVLSDRFIAEDGRGSMPEVDGSASDNDLTLESSSEVTVDSVTTTSCTFTRPLLATDPTTDRAVAGQYLIWAVGPVNSDTPAKHSAKGYDNNPYNMNRIDFFGAGGSSRQRSRRDLTETVAFDITSDGAWGCWADDSGNANITIALNTEVEELEELIGGDEDGAWGAWAVVTEPYTYSWDETPTISDVTPKELSASITEDITIAGDFVGYSDDAACSSISTSNNAAEAPCCARMSLVVYQDTAWGGWGSALDRPCKNLVINDTHATCTYVRSEPLPEDLQNKVFPKLELCDQAARTVRIAHPEPPSAALDLGMRLTHVSPQSGSFAGGTRVTIAGAGFANTGATVVRSNLLTNYLDSMNAVEIATCSGRKYPCNIITSNHTHIVCDLEESNETGPLALSDDFGTLEVRVNDFIASGCPLTEICTSLAEYATWEAENVVSDSLDDSGSGSESGTDSGSGSESGGELIGSSSGLDHGATDDAEGNSSHLTQPVFGIDDVARFCSGFLFAVDSTPVMAEVTWDDAPAADGTVVVQVTGMNLLGATEVWLGDDACSIDDASQDDIIVCTAPAMCAGTYVVRVFVPLHGFARSIAVEGLTYQVMLELIAVSPAEGSTAGGTRVTIEGRGFSDKSTNANIVAVWGAAAEVISANHTFLEIVTPANADLVITNTSINIFVQVETDAGKGNNSTAVGTSCNPICEFGYSVDKTPAVTSVDPVSGSEGARITIHGTFASAATAVSIGGQPCTNVASDAAAVECTLGATPAGMHAVYVTATPWGTATSTATFESLLDVASISKTSGSYGGGDTIVLQGSGFGGGAVGSQRERRDGAWSGWDIIDGECNHILNTRSETIVTICGSPCLVIESTYEEVTCITSPLHSVDSLNEFNHIEPVVLTGTKYPASSQSYALDGDFQTHEYQNNGGDGTSCEIGLDLGEDRAVLTKVRFFPDYRHLSDMVGTVFKTSIDGVTWIEVAIVTEKPRAGWSELKVNATDAIKFVRLEQYGGQRCRLTEVEFVGVQVAVNSTCPIVVETTGTATHPSVGPVTTDDSAIISTTTTTLMFTYDLALTPIVTSIEPVFGSALGGETITITGTGLAAAAEDASVEMNGVDCVVTSATPTEIQCVTGARQNICPPYLRVGQRPLGGGYAVQNETVAFRYLDRWSQRNTWLNDEPPIEGDSVIVPEGQAILMDVSPPQLFLVQIFGMLVFDRKDLTLDATYIIIHGGTMEVGTEAEPFEHNAVITLHGDRRDTIELPFFGAKVLAVADKGGMSNSGDSSGGEVPLSQKGVLDIHGKKRLTVWTKVATPGASAGDTSFEVVDAVDFVEGEEIVLSVPPEKAVVASVTNGGHTVWVKEPLVYDHTSVYEVYDNAESGHWEVDMRCEVGLLTRNVVIQGDEGSVSQKFGCHTVAMHGGHYRVEGAEIRHCGQAGNLGRYSTHFHVNGPNPPPNSYVRFNSIHDSFQRATTVHSTEHALVEGNFAYNNMAHNFFVEDGDEKYNVFERNLVIGSKNSPFMLKSDAMHASFWTATPQNIWRDNVATGSEDRGMWFEFCDSESRVCDKTGPTIEFTGNSFHHNNGIGWRNYPHYLPSKPQYFYNNTFHHNGGNGVFGKKYGDVHHVNSFWVENNVDLNWKKFPNANPDSYFIPNVQDSLFISESSSTLAIFAPNAEFWYASGVTFKGYGNQGIGTIAGCNGCCSVISPKQGGYTFRWEKLVWDSQAAAKKIEWTCPYKQIFFDMDGSLTGIANGTATPFYKFNEYSEPGVHPGGGATHTPCIRQDEVYDKGIICDDTVRVRRLQIKGVSSGGSNSGFLDDKRIELRQSRTEFVETDGVTEGGEDVEQLHGGGYNWTRYADEGVMYDGNCTNMRGFDAGGGCIEWDKGADYINFRARDYYGWAIPVVTHANYYVDFDYNTDWKEMKVRWSEPFYIQTYSTPDVEERVLLRWPYIDYRYKYDIKNDASKEVMAWYPGKVHDITTLTDSRFSSEALDKYGVTAASEFGVSQIFRKDNTLATTGSTGEVRVSLNPWEGPPWSNQGFNRWGDPLRYSAVRDQCAPDMCILPCSRNTGDPMLWSDVSGTTWRTFRTSSMSVPSEAGGYISPLTVHHSLVSWQLEETLTVAPTTAYLNMEIPAGFNMILDAQPPRFEKLIVGCKARLEFDHTSLSTGGIISLEADNILVFGSLIIGTAEAPWPSDIIARVQMHGDRITTKTLVADAENDLGNKVLAVFGDLEMHSSSAPSVAWTTLASTAVTGSKLLLLSESVDWNVGDRLIVASTDLPIYRSGMPSETGGTDPRYVLESVDGRHDEFATIKAISTNGMIVTLEEPLHQEHFAGDVNYGEGSMRMAAHVGMLTRSIVFEGNLTSNGANGDWYKGYGAHMVVGEALFEAEGDSPVTKFGSLKAVGVEFRDVGKHNSEHSAIFFNYRTAFTADTAPTNIIDGCSINAWNPAIVSKGTYGLSVTQSVVARTYDVGIDVDRTSHGTVLEDILMVGNYRSPSDEFTFTVCGYDNSCRYLPFAAFHLWNTDLASVKRNVVAGAEDTGFVAHLMDSCDPSVPAIFEDNEAYGTLIGFHLMTKLGGCGELRNFKAWKNAHIGIHATDANSDIQLRSVQVADNHMGINLNFVKKGDENEVRIIDSVIIGDSEATTCSDPTCQTISQGSYAGRTCASSFGKSWRRIGLVIPQYNNMAKTCGATNMGLPSQGAIAVCRRPLMLFRMCQLPFDNRFGNMGAGLPGMYHADLHLENVAFANFHTNDCNLRSRAIAHHAEVPDMTPTMHFSGITKHDVDPDAFVQLGDVDYMGKVGAACKNFCDAVMHMVLHDLDGTTSGAVGTMVADRNHFNEADDVTQGIVDNPACVHSLDTMSLNCPTIPFIRTTLEAIDQDRKKRRIGPVKVYKYGAERNSTMFSEGVFPQGCSCQKHFSQFHFQLQAGYHYDIETRGSIPGNTRIKFPSNDTNDAMLLRIWFTQPMEVYVFVDGLKVAPTNGTKPTIADAAGTNVLDPQERWLYLTVRGGSREYQLTVSDVIQVTAAIKMSREEFFNDQNEEVMVTNFATLLGIPAHRIKVVCVHYIGQPCLGRRRREAEGGLDCSTGECGDLQVKVEISPPNDVTADDATVTSKQLEENFAAMAELITKVNEVVVESTALADALNAAGIPASNEVVFMPPASVGAELYQSAVESGGIVASPNASLTDVFTPNTTTTPQPIYTVAPSDTSEVSFWLDVGCNNTAVDEVVQTYIDQAIVESISITFAAGFQNPDSENIDMLELTQEPAVGCIVCDRDAGLLAATVAIDVPFILPLYKKLLVGELTVPINITGINASVLTATAKFGPSVCPEELADADGSGSASGLDDSGSGEERDVSFDIVTKHTLQFFFTSLPDTMSQAAATELIEGVYSLIESNTALTRDYVERVDLLNIVVAASSRLRRATPTAEVVLQASVTDEDAADALGGLYGASSLDVSVDGIDYTVAAVLGGSVGDDSTTTTTGTTTTTTGTTTTTTGTTTTTTGTDTTTTIYDPENVDCIESQDSCTNACELAADRNYVLTSAHVKNGRACRGATDCADGDGACTVADGITDDATATTTTTTTTATDDITDAVGDVNESVTNNGGMRPGLVVGIVVSVLILIAAAVLALMAEHKKSKHSKVAPAIVERQGVDALFPRVSIHHHHSDIDAKLNSNGKGAPAPPTGRDISDLQVTQVSRGNVRPSMGDVRNTPGRPLSTSNPPTPAWAGNQTPLPPLQSPPARTRVSFGGSQA